MVQSPSGCYTIIPTMLILKTSTWSYTIPTCNTAQKDVYYKYSRGLGCFKGNLAHYFFINGTILFENRNEAKTAICMDKLYKPEVFIDT